MGIVTDVRVRQPRRDDLVGRQFVVAGVGGGFEGTIGIRVLGPRDRVLAEGLPDEGPRPGFNTRTVEVICFPEQRGFLLYRVESGDTLTGIVRKLRDFTRVTVGQVVAANPRIEDPDLIVAGWRLRIPVQS